MSILPWNRINNLDIYSDKNNFNSLQREMNRLFEDFLGDFNLPNTTNRELTAIPAIDIVENDSGYKISAELPAMDSNDVDISINANYLTIKGEKKECKEERDKKDTVVRSERYYGSYKRTIALAENADVDKAEAEFKNGVLHIAIPKKQESQSKSRKIEIKTTE